METNDTIATLAEILGMEPAMLRRAVEAARARNDEAGLSALMMRAADAKMAAGLTDNIRRTVRGEQAGAFSVAICMEWNALYEQALTATETALSEVTHQRDVFRSCLRRAAESVSAHPLSGSESADALVDMVQRALAEERAKREEAEVFEALHSDAIRLLREANATIDAAWQATGVASTVRGLTTLDDVVSAHRQSLIEQRDRADRAEKELREANNTRGLKWALTTAEATVVELKHQRDVLRARAEAAEEKAARLEKNAQDVKYWEQRAWGESQTSSERLRRAEAAEAKLAELLDATKADAWGYATRAQERADRAEAALATARSEALREAAGVPSQVIAELRHRGLLTAGDESVARSIESGILALIGASESGPARVAETIFTCRTCGASTKGWSDGRFAATGWRRLDHIDGPNAICPACVADPTALDCLRDEYPRVALASESGEGGSDGQP